MGRLLLTAAILFLASPAAAGSSDAEALFREGRRLVQSGDYASACPKFAESERIEPAPGTILNLADCEEHLGKLVSAREHFDLAASGFPRGDKRRTVATERAAALDARLVRLTLHLAPGAPAGTVVRKGGVVVDHGALGQPALADPGPLRIVVSAPGRSDRVYPLTLQEGASVDTSVDVGDPAPEPAAAAAAAAAGTAAPVPTGGQVGVAETSPPERAPVRPRPNTSRTVGWVLVGVGGVGIVAGAVTGVLAWTKSHIVKDHCDANMVCDQEGYDASSSGKVFSTVSTVSFIGGAALAGAGALLVILSPKAPKGPPPLALLPYAAPAGHGAQLGGIAGVSLKGSF